MNTHTPPIPHPLKSHASRKCKKERDLLIGVIFVLCFPYVEQFGFMIKPLFESFKVMVTTTTSDEFSQSVTNWVKEKLALPNLRIGTRFFWSETKLLNPINNLIL